MAALLLRLYAGAIFLTNSRLTAVHACGMATRATRAHPNLPQAARCPRSIAADWWVCPGHSGTRVPRTHVPTARLRVPLAVADPAGRCLLPYYVRQLFLHML